MISLPSVDDAGVQPYKQGQCGALPRTQGSRNDRLTAWFERWRVPIQRWIASHASMSTADLDDLVQEVFLRLMRYSDDSAIEYPQTYLFRIASNVASEWRERAKRHPMQDESCFEGLQIETDDEPENIIAHVLISKRVQLAVERLPPRQRQVLMLHIHESLTRPQIAERLGLTCRMVRRDLAHAYTQLRWDLDAELLQDSLARGKVAAP